MTALKPESVEQALERLGAQRDAWRALALAQGHALTSYRVGFGVPPLETLDAVERAKAELLALGVDLQEIR